MTMRTLTTLLTMIVSAGALWLTFKLADEIGKIELHRTPSVGWLSAAVLFQLSIVYLLTLRWYRLTQTMKGKSGSLDIFQFGRITWAGLGLSQIVLGPVSADALRVASLKECDIPVSESLHIVLLDRIIGVTGLLVVGVIAFGFSLAIAQLATFSALLLVGVTSGAACIWLLARAPGFVGKLAGNFGAIMCTLNGCRLLALAALAHTLNVGIYVCIAYSIGLAPPMPETIVSVVGGLLSGLVPISFGGWGIRELVIFQSFEYQNAAFQGAVTISILFGLIHIAMGIPGLLLFGWRKTIQLAHNSEIKRNV